MVANPAHDQLKGTRPHAPENFVSRDRFGRPIPRQPKRSPKIPCVYFVLSLGVFWCILYLFVITTTVVRGTVLHALSIMSCVFSMMCCAVFFSVLYRTLFVICYRRYVLPYFLFLNHIVIELYK